MIIKTLKYHLKNLNHFRLIKKRRLFFLQFLTKKSDIYFDVGANIGNRIYPIRNCGFKIVAIEPNPICVDTLKIIFKNKILVEECGLAESEGDNILNVCESNTISSFSQKWIEQTTESGRFYGYNWEEKIRVKIKTLDSLINKHGIPKFIKIDVEGYEYNVLCGLNQPIEFISFEYTVPERVDEVIKCIDRINFLASGKKVLFNYSTGENLNWALNEWVTTKKFKEEIKSMEFLATSFGDIYANTI